MRTWHLLSRCKVLQRVVNIYCIKYDSDIEEQCGTDFCNGFPFKETAFSQTSSAILQKSLFN